MVLPLLLTTGGLRVGECEFRPSDVPGVKIAFVLLLTVYPQPLAQSSA